MGNTVNINEILNNLPVINPDRNYWLVRTKSGKYYQEFKENNFVAIGWNEITSADLNDLHQNPNNTELFNDVKSRVRSDRYSDEDESNDSPASQSKALGQLLKFAYEIKRGDIVVIPSSNSDYLTFGEVDETPVFISDSGICEFKKRKKISWIKKDVRRLSLDSTLYRFIFAHQTINNVTEYAQYINSTLFDFYTISGKSSLVLRLKKEQEIDPFEMNVLYDDLLFFMKEFSEENGETVVRGSVNVKFDLQSPGTIIFAGLIVMGMLAIGIFTVFAGGESDINFDVSQGKFNTKFKANSFLDKLSDFLDKRLDRRERASRLVLSLRQFEVEENKNLKLLAETEIDKSNQGENDVSND